MALSATPATKFLLKSQPNSISLPYHSFSRSRKKERSNFLLSHSQPRPHIAAITLSTATNSAASVQLKMRPLNKYFNNVLLQQQYLVLDTEQKKYIFLRYFVSNDVLSSLLKHNSTFQVRDQERDKIRERYNIEKKPTPEVYQMFF